MPSWPHWWVALALCIPGTSLSRELDPSSSLTRGTIQILVRKSLERNLLLLLVSVFCMPLCVFFFFLIYVSVPRLRHLEQTDCFNMLLTVRVLPILICFSMGGRDSLKQIQILPMYNSLWLVLFSDLLTVSETANEPPQEEGNSFNSPRNLAMEATYINHNFSQQCLRMVRLSSPGQ